MDSNKDVLSLGQLITKLRKDKGYSQRKFAQISGLSNTTISRIENGETHNPGIETLKLLAAHLDYDDSKLVKLVDLNKKNSGPKANARLKFLQQPVREIKRYSSVIGAIQEQVQEQQVQLVHEPVLEQKQEEIPNQEPLKKVLLKGMKLITLRLEKNITQKELADALGIDKTLISQYEGEIIKPDYNTVQKLADFFGVAIEYLVGEAGVERTTYAEPKDTYRTVNKDKPLIRNELRPEYLAIAEEIQAAGIEIEDIRAFINMIVKYRSNR